MATFIFFWNPEISSYKLDEHREILRGNGVFENWSIWEHTEVAEGDTFYLIRCKNRPEPGKVNKYGKQLWVPVLDDTTGICIAGTIISEAWQGEDWSGKGRETYYVDLDVDYMTDPDENIIITSKELMQQLPEFDWTGGHSGRKLDYALAQKLDDMVEKRIKEIIESSDKV